MTPYQDQWNGTDTLSKGYRECIHRYEVIATVLRSVATPFTVLDVGAAEGYFSARIASEFNAFVTAVETRPLKATHRHARLKWIQQHATPSDIRDLGSFDVVLGLSLLHHMKDWPEMLGALHAVARHSLIIETPHPDEKLKVADARHDLAKIDAAIRDLGAVRIGEAPGVWEKTLMRGIYRVAARERGED